MPGQPHEDAAASFDPLRPKLIRVAYRMLGSVADAEDVVQEAFIRWMGADRTGVREPEAFLRRTVTRLCLDQLKLARHQRETYVGPWLPDPVVEEEEQEDVTLPLMLALERLSPLERAAFLLHDVFGLAFEEVAATIQREPAACRQLAARARTHVRKARPRFRVEKERGLKLAEAFFTASRSGDMTALGAMLAADVSVHADGGGKRSAALRPLIGFDEVMKVHAYLAARFIEHGSRLFRTGFINGLPGFVTLEADGEFQRTALEIEDGKVAAIYIVRNPDKLRHCISRKTSPLCLSQQNRFHLAVKTSSIRSRVWRLSMTSSFNVHNAAGYEQLMGRWSRRLAPLFIDFAGLGDGEKILDVGCGTGSLTFTLAANADLAEIDAIDYSPVFVEEAARRNTDPRIKIRQADACALPYEDGTFDRALALLVLHFVPEAGQAVAEMRRVVRPGGVVAAAVWDHLGGMPGMRMMVDTVAAISEGGRRLRQRFCFQPMMQPGEMQQTFVEQGLMDVTETQLMIRMDYQSFDDFWAPIAAGEGPLGQYVTTLDTAERARIEAGVRDAYQAGRPDGPRSFANVAWACRGAVP